MRAPLATDDVKGVILGASEAPRRARNAFSHEPRSFVPQDDTARRRHSRVSRSPSRCLRCVGVAALLALILTGCATSPEAARVRGEPGADVGNHGNPVVLLEPPNRVERVYTGVPFDEPAVAQPDTSQS